MDSIERMETASDYISPVDLTWKRLDADSPRLFSSVSKFDLLLVSDNDDGSPTHIKWLAELTLLQDLFGRLLKPSEARRG